MSYLRWGGPPPRVRDRDSIVASSRATRLAKYGQWHPPSAIAANRAAHEHRPVWHSGRTHCVNGHEFTRGNTYRGIDKKTGREHRTCRTCALARYRSREKAA